MNRTEFTTAFAKAYQIPISTAKEVCKVFDYLAFVIKEGKEESIYIHGLGVFKHKTRKAKNLRHPQTGEIITIPERDEVVFTLTPSPVANAYDDKAETD